MAESEVVMSEEVLRRYLAGERDFSGLEIEDAAKSAPLRGAILDDADFSRAFIVADFSKASLRGARFVEANVKTCSFTDANLSGADFTGAALCSTTFHGAQMDSARFRGAYFHSYELGDAEKPDW
jgi:uncharacterized protein YjbI with pentapeptide repeats